MELKSYSHSKGVNIFHFEWTPKCRYNMFRKPIYINACEVFLREICARHKIIVIELAVMPDHIHLVAELPLDMSPARAKQLLKGGSAYMLFKMYPELRLRYPRGHFWSAGNFCRTVSDIDLETVQNYVREQNPFQKSLTDFSN